MRAAIFAGVLSYYAIAYVLIGLSSPIERLDAPVETSLAMIDLAGPPPTARHDAYRIDVSPPYRENAREISSCSVPVGRWSRRIAGEACVHPSEDDREQMVHDGIDHTAGVFKLCISATGLVTSVTRLRSTKYEGYDQRLLAAIRDWRLLPYLVDGQPRPVCSAVTFLYTIK